MNAAVREARGFSVLVTDPQGAQRRTVVRGRSATIGRGRECEIRLGGWRVGREHARIFRTQAGLVIEDLGQFGGTWINGQRSVQYGPLGARDEISLGGFKLRVIDGVPDEAGVVSNGVPIESGEAELPARPAAPPAMPAEAGGTPADVQAAWRRRIHESLLDTIDLRRRDLLRMSEDDLRRETDGLIREIMDGQPELPATIDREALVRDVLNEAIGLGPLEALLNDDRVTEIMVNRYDEIYVECEGRLQRHPAVFTGERAVLGIIERIVAPTGRRVDESSPMVDARLKDGSRVNAVLPPLALKGPTLTIRKFSRQPLDAGRLLAAGSLSAAMAGFLETCVVHRRNVVVSGGTGSGKTTLLNVLSNFIPDGERIVTVEDAAELRLNHSHWVALEARPANAEGRGQVTIRDLVRNALRMRPDRIVVGECRSGEALDMLQAMNTGHEGSLTTLHANSPRDALARLETMVLMAGMDLPLSAIREQIAAAVDVIVQQTRFACGTRRITSIAEVTGHESGRLQLQELFRFQPEGRDAAGKVQGRFLACETVPSFYQALRAHGVAVDVSPFTAGEGASG